MGWAAILGAGAMASGSAATAYGNQQALKSMRKNFDLQQAEEKGVEDEWRQRLARFLEQSTSDREAEAFRKEKLDQESTLTGVSDVLMASDASRETAAAGGVGGASGQVTSSTEGIAPRANLNARRVAANLGRREAAGVVQSDLRETGNERQRLADKLRGVRRLYPYRAGAAATKGHATRTAGAGLSQLGQMLLMYEMNQPGVDAGGAGGTSGASGGIGPIGQAPYSGPSPYQF